MKNRNNFKIGFENYLKSKLVLITCCEIIIKYKDKINIFSLVYENDKYGERKRERISRCSFLSGMIISVGGRSFFFKRTMKSSIYSP